MGDSAVQLFVHALHIADSHEHLTPLNRIFGTDDVGLIHG